MDNQITYIDIDQIYPHPDNPRKDLGDLTELAQSIQENGIMQNLTVVPRDKTTYTVIIGHRRHAASALAGLKQLPCIIAEMDEKKQIATMLLENMQRSDLTLYEQAQGMQMMMDLGESVADIAKQTGFSDSTIRRRVKLLDLDGEKFRASVERGATLMDFAELEKIQDPEIKDKLMDSIGTSDFKFRLKQAIDEDEWRQRRADIISTLDGFAQRVDSSDGYIAVQYINRYGSAFTLPDDIENTDYFYCTEPYFILLKKKIAAEDAQPTAPDPKQAVMEETRAALKEIANQAYALRSDFIRTCSNSVARKNIPAIIAFLGNQLLDRNWFNFDAKDMIDLLGDHATALQLDAKEDGDDERNETYSLDRSYPEKSLLILAYLCTGDDERNDCHAWNNRYKENTDLMRIYDFLEELGYTMAEEERAYINGTHTLFAPAEDEENA